MTLTQLLIVCPLVFLAGLIDAVAGGGGLISLPAYLAAGLPPHMALGSNKFSSSCGTIISCTRYIQHKRVFWPTALTAIGGALLGSPLGAQAILVVDTSIVRILMLVAIPLVALLVLVRKNFGDTAQPRPFGAKAALVISGVIGLVVGFYDGFFGPGTGTFLVMLFTAVLGYDLVTASGNAKLVNLASNIGSFTMFLIHGHVMLPLAAVAAVFGIAGHYVGAGLAIKQGGRIIRPMFIVVLTLLLLYILKDTVPALQVW